MNCFSENHLLLFLIYDQNSYCYMVIDRSGSSFMFIETAASWKSARQQTYKIKIIFIEDYL